MLVYFVFNNVYIFKGVMIYILWLLPISSWNKPGHYSIHTTRLVTKLNLLNENLLKYVCKTEKIHVGETSS